MRNSLRENSRLEELNSMHSQRLCELEALDKMDFGLAEFRQLFNHINETAEAKGMSTERNTAVKWFFENLRAHHYDYLDLGKAVQERKSELADLNTRQDNQAEALNLIVDVTKAVN
jgi:hypothetical protein